MSRKSLRHKSDLDEGLYPEVEVGTQNLIDDGPVVNRPSRSIFGICIGGPPLECRDAVARCQQIVGSYLNRFLTQFREFFQQPAAIPGVGVVRLVVSEVVPDGP